ncbi:MAG: hypothetical protein C5B47_07255 [Verrucomicrobia bacterium]|nr:MAG: hypothetical protein C5B47_07255 [Verrucomicrobiota bacterium]
MGYFLNFRFLKDTHPTLPDFFKAPLIENYGFSIYELVVEKRFRGNQRSWSGLAGRQSWLVNGSLNKNAYPPY